MNIILWIFQEILTATFLFAGVDLLLSYFDGTVAFDGVVIGRGAVVTVAGLGLILPGLFRIQTRVTPLAALLLVLFHCYRIEWLEGKHDGAEVLVWVTAALCGFVAYGRWRPSPLKDRSNATSP